MEAMHEARFGLRIGSGDFVTLQAANTDGSRPNSGPTAHGFPAIDAGMGIKLQRILTIVRQGEGR